MLLSKHELYKKSNTSLSLRFKANKFTNIYMKVGGTDCRILDPSPFNTKCYSYKFNGPDVCYEVCISIGNGQVAWIIEPFSCGTYLHIKRFNSYLEKILLSDEQCIADRGYASQSCVYRVNNYEGVSSRL